MKGNIAEPKLLYRMVPFVNLSRRQINANDASIWKLNCQRDQISTACTAKLQNGCSFGKGRLQLKQASQRIHMIWVGSLIGMAWIRNVVIRIRLNGSSSVRRHYFIFLNRIKEVVQRHQGANAWLPNCGLRRISLPTFEFIPSLAPIKSNAVIRSC